MTTIFADHGDHGYFLTMALNVLVGKSEIKSDQAIFDFWRGEISPKKFPFEIKYKHDFMKKQFLNRKFIWITRDDPILWAYNLCTRAVLSRVENFHDYKKGIDIKEFENNPWKWAPNCDITGLTKLYKIRKKDDGSINKKSLRAWYREYIFNEHWLTQKTPKRATPFLISNFYHIEKFSNNLMKIQNELNVDFDWNKVEVLYNVLHSTLSYTDESAHTTPTALLETFQQLEIKNIP